MSVTENIAAGAYVNTFTYPHSPSKPTLGFRATAAQAREYADKLEAYEAAKTAQRAAREAYGAETARLEAQFRADLEAEYGMKGHPKADKLFSKAWEMGHSSGYGEVANYYDDLHELVA